MILFLLSHPTIVKSDPVVKKFFKENDPDYLHAILSSYGIPPLLVPNSSSFTHDETKKEVVDFFKQAVRYRANFTRLFKFNSLLFNKTRSIAYTFENIQSFLFPLLQLKVIHPNVDFFNSLPEIDTLSNLLSLRPLLSFVFANFPKQNITRKLGILSVKSKSDPFRTKLLSILLLQEKTPLPLND